MRYLFEVGAGCFSGLEVLTSEWPTIPFIEGEPATRDGGQLR